MAEMTNVFKTDNGVLISLDAKSIKIDDADVLLLYRIHGKMTLGIPLLKSEQKTLNTLMVSYQPVIKLTQDKSVVELKLGMHEIQSLQGFLQSAFNEIFGRGVTTFEQILQNNNVFNRISVQDRTIIDSELHEINENTK